MECPFYFQWEIFREPYKVLKTPEWNTNKALVLCPKLENLNLGLGNISEYNFQNDVIAVDDEFKDFFFKNFQIKDKFLLKAQNKLRSLKRVHINKHKSFRNPDRIEQQKLGNTIFIGVHIRRTDHLLYEDELKVKRLEPDYFLEAMNMYRKKFNVEHQQKEIIFVLVSDDKNWAKQAILYQIEEEDVYWGGSDSPAEDDSIGNDFAVLAICNHTLQSHGTFSHFAGAFAGGYRIKPNHFSEYREPKQKNNTFWTQDPLNDIPPRLSAF